MEQYQETLANLSRAIAQNPGDAHTLAQRGETYRLIERYPEALADFNRAIDLKPDYAWAMAHRGETYRLLRCYQEALTDFNCTLELRPDQAWALAHRGVIYELMGCYQEALTDFDRAIELEPDYVWSLVHRGNTYIMMRYYEEALTDLDQAIALDKTIISPWPGERGLLLNFMGRYEETIAGCEQGLRENPADHIAMYSLVVAKVRWKGLTNAQAKIAETRTLLQTVLQRAVNIVVRAGTLYRLGGLAALEDRAWS